MRRWNILVVIMCLVLMNYDALAYDEKFTHPYITDAAIGRSILNDYLKSYLGVTNGIRQEYDGISISDLIKTGSTNEDLSSRPRNHFWNPLKDEGLDDNYIIHFSGEPNRIWALGYEVNTGNPLYSCSSGDNSTSSSCNDYSWRIARDEFYKALTSTTESIRNDHFKKMYEGLGRILHLMEDMGVPAHTRDDFAGDLNYTELEMWYKIFNPKNYLGNLYEFHVKRKAKDDASYISSFSPSAIVPTLNTPQEYWGNGNYTGANPDQTIVNNGAGLAEYCNANFLSRCTIFTNNLSQDDKHYFPFPNESSVSIPCPHIITAEDGKPDMVLHFNKEKDGEQINNFVAAKYVWDRFYLENPMTADYRLAFYLDDTVHEAYAGKLIPKTIGYATGLINYFFRGTISITGNTIETFDEIYRIHLSATNTTNSSEEMDNGDICLVIKYPIGFKKGYIVVPELNSITHIPRGGSIPLSFDVPRNDLPDNQLNGLLDLFVVYKGNLTGAIIHENDAVCVGYQQMEYFSLREILTDGGYSGSVNYSGAGCVDNLSKGCSYKLSIENKTGCSDCCATFVVYDLIGNDNETGACPSIYAGSTAIGEVIHDLHSYDRQNIAKVYWCDLGIGFGYEFHTPLFYEGIFKFDVVLTNMTTGFELCRETVIFQSP